MHQIFLFNSYKSYQNLKKQQHRCQIPTSDTSFKDLFLKDEHKKVYYQLFCYLLCSTEIMIFILQDRVFFESHATFATLSDKKNDLFYRSYVMIRNITLHISKYKSLEDKKRWKSFLYLHGIFEIDTFYAYSLIHSSFLSACSRIFYR